MDEGNVQRVDAPVTVSVLFEVNLFAIVVDESLAESVIREREKGVMKSYITLVEKLDCIVGVYRVPL